MLLCKRAIEPCAGKWGIPQGTVRAGRVGCNAHRSFLLGCVPPLPLSCIVNKYAHPSFRLHGARGEYTRRRSQRGARGGGSGHRTWTPPSGLQRARPGALNLSLLPHQNRHTLHHCYIAPHLRQISEFSIGVCVPTPSCRTQVQLLYLSQMRTSAMSAGGCTATNPQRCLVRYSCFWTPSPGLVAGIESRQVGLFTWDEALQMDLAFPTVSPTPRTS